MTIKAEPFSAAVLQQNWGAALLALDRSPALVRDPYDRAMLRAVILAKLGRSDEALPEAETALRFRVHDKWAVWLRGALLAASSAAKVGPLAVAKSATQAMASFPALATEFAAIASTALAQAPFGLKKLKRIKQLRDARRQAGVQALTARQLNGLPWEQWQFRTLCSLHDDAQAHGNVIPLGPRETIPIAHPASADGVVPEDILVEGYPAEVRCHRNITAIGNSSLLISADGAALSDPMTDERYGAQVIAHGDEILVVRCGGVVLTSSKPPARRIDTAVWLAGLVSNHFGHWFAGSVSV